MQSRSCFSEYMLKKMRGAAVGSLERSLTQPRLRGCSRLGPMAKRWIGGAVTPGNQSCASRPTEEQIIWMSGRAEFTLGVRKKMLAGAALVAKGPVLVRYHCIMPSTARSKRRWLRKVRLSELLKTMPMIG